MPLAAATVIGAAPAAVETTGELAAGLAPVELEQAATTIPRPTSVVAR
jgi:hypothetical protein